MIKNLLLTAFLALAVIFSFGAVTAQAYNPLGEACSLRSDANTCDNQQGDNLTGNDGVFLKVVRIIAFLAGSAAIILIVVSGIQYVTSNGDANKISSAKNTIIYAIVGLVIIFASQAIITYVIRELTS